jgi:imidazole glycerol phosphate synthase subunit HisF
MNDDVKYYIPESELLSSLEVMLTDLVAMKTEAAPMLDAIKQLEKRIKQHVMDTGEVAEVDSAKVTIRNGYTRVSWDGKALSGFAAAHPEILEFRKEKDIGPSAVIKVTL